MAVTNATRQYKIIYVYSVPYDDHKDLLKIGKAEVDVEEDYYPLKIQVYLHHNIYYF